MKTNILLLVLSLLILGGCATVHKNGYYQTKRYKVKNVKWGHSYAKKRKTPTRIEIAEKTQITTDFSGKSLQSIDTHNNASAPTLIEPVDKGKTPTTPYKTASPKDKLPSFKKIAKTLKDDIAFAKKDLQDEPQPVYREKEYNIPSVVASIIMLSGILLSLLGGYLVFPGLLILSFIGGIVAIVLAFMGWRDYREDRDRYKGKFFIYFAYVYAWLQIISVILLIALIALLLSQI